MLARREAAAARMGLERLLDEPRVLDQPKTPTVVDLRLDKTASGTTKGLVAKVVETREYRELIDTVEERTGGEGSKYERIVTKTFGVTAVRSVNVVQLNSDGLLEVRIQTHESALDYQREASQLLLGLNALLPSKEVSSYGVVNAKDNIWRRRRDLGGTIEYGVSLLRNTAGTTMTVAPGGEQLSLLDDSGASGSIDLFVKNEGSFEKSDFRVRRIIKALATETSTHAIIGETNEVTISGQCSREDYENVLRIIVENNGPVS